MRATMITLQAAILSILAVVGAMGDSGQKHSCPLPSAQADLHCQE